MKKLAFLLLLFSLSACNSQPKDDSIDDCAAGKSETTPSCTLTEEPVVPDDGIPEDTTPDQEPTPGGTTTGGTTTGETTTGETTTGGTTTGETTTGGTATGGTATGGTTTGGTTTGGTTTGGTTTGGTTTGGTTTGGTTTGGTTTGGTTTGGTTTGGTTTDVPAEALTWDADIYYVNFNEDQELKVQKAVSLMKKVIASKAFKDGVINHTYNGVKTFVDNGGHTNQQIYQKILDGAEKMGITSKNNRMDVELELYYAATSTIGYTYPNVTRIWMNTKYFNGYTPVNVTGNLMHEWLHKLGFGHATTYSVSRDYSVPYAVGYLMERLAKQHQ